MRMRQNYPILLDVEERLCVIVGGGEVAARKAAGLIEAGAKRVRVVAAQFKGVFADEVERLQESYRPAHLDGAGLVFAATDSPAVNDAVVRDAQERGVLVSRADSADERIGDFIVPARWRNGPVTVTVSAGSAALAVRIRDALAQRWEPRWTKMAEAMQVLREELQQGEADAEQRRRLFRDLATDEAMNVLEGKGIDGLRRWALQRRSRAEKKS
jgi:precorrin-2 dehydrogenase/sirohydrochlorin ferrochelatase